MLKMQTRCRGNMSFLDRAIVKAFQRRRDSEAVAKTAAVECCAVETAPESPAIVSGEPRTSRDATVPSSDEYLNLHYSTSIPAAVVPQVRSNQPGNGQDQSRFGIGPTRLFLQRHHLNHHNCHQSFRCSLRPTQRAGQPIRPVSCEHRTRYPRPTMSPDRTAS